MRYGKSSTPGIKRPKKTQSAASAVTTITQHRTGLTSKKRLRSWSSPRCARRNTLLTEEMNIAVVKRYMCNSDWNYSCSDSTLVDPAAAGHDLRPGPYQHTNNKCPHGYPVVEGYWCIKCVCNELGVDIPSSLSLSSAHAETQKEIDNLKITFYSQEATRLGTLLDAPSMERS